MKRYLFIFIAVFTLFPGCRQRYFRSGESVNNSSQNAISVAGTRFTDSFGRQVIFSGINKVNKDPEKNYTDGDSIGIYEQFRKWGFNCVRLGVMWDGVEPEPGKYDEKYLDKLEEQVNWASQNGVYVLLDMHQDLYGVSFGDGTSSLGDGAPRWATLTDNQPHVRGAIWSESYLISPAVQKAFDNFWANTPVADGVGVQDHFANMWEHVAKRFAGNRSVIGYDIMNEPFNGTSGSYFVPLIIREYIKMNAEETGRKLSENEGMALFADEEKRFGILTQLQNPEKYSRVFDSARDLCQQFEKTELQSMYQHVSNAIREVDTTHILFLEHGYFMNTGISSSIEPVKGIDGKPDPHVAYAGHGYDLLVDTKYYDNQSNSRVEFIFSRINGTSERLNIPVLVGEWGALSGNSEAVKSSARFITGLIDRLGFSNTYWAYYPGIGNDLYFADAIIRPYPQLTGGILRSYGYNRETGIFTCSWEESPLVKAPTVIYLPDIENLKTKNISLKPSAGKTEIRPVKESKAGYLIIPVTGESATRTVEISLI